MELPALLDHFFADVRWALRAIRKAPGTTAVAVLSVALGVGANTAIFSLVNAVLLRSLPVPAPEQLRLVASPTNRGTPSTTWNYPDTKAFRSGLAGDAEVAAMSGVQALGMQEHRGGAVQSAELAQAQFISGNYFQVLGVEAALGRVLSSSDDQLGGSPWVVLSHGYWKGRFLGDPGVVGRQVRLNGYPFTIIGVAREGFRGTDPTSDVNLWVPVVMRTEIAGVPQGVWNSRRYWWLYALLRVKPGVNAAELETRLTTLAEAQEEAERRINPRRGQVNKGRTLLTLPAGNGYTSTRYVLQKPLIILMSVVGVVLLIACANLANIMLARGAGRQRDVAVRLAIGASRRRIAAQLLTEGVLVALLGGLASIGLAYAGVRLLVAVLVPESGSTVTDIQLEPDLYVLGFTVAASACTGLLAALAPAFQATRPDLTSALRDQSLASAGSSKVWLRRALVVVQVTLSLVLVVGATLFARSLSNLRSLETGFRKEQSLLVFTEPGRNGYKGQRLHDFYERLLSEVQQLPHVRSASLAFTTPLAGSRWNGDFAVEGYEWKAEDEHYVDMNAVGPRFFETLGIPLLMGREFTERDSPSQLPDPPTTISPEPQPELPGPPLVAIVNQAFAKRFLAGGSPLGRRISMTEKYDPARAYEVVGLVKDVRFFGMKEDLVPMIYLPVWRGPGSERTLCLRTTGEPGAVTNDVRKLIAGIDRAVPLLRARTLEYQVDRNLMQERLMSSLATVFGGLALLLAAVGLYGLLSFLVTARRREIGIRIAIGATRGHVLWLVVRDAAWLVGVGLLGGTAVALALTRYVRSFLFGIGAQDPATFVAGGIILMVVSACAVIVPALRAMRVQPGESLRYE